MRKNFPKPPAILKMPAEYFLKPKQELDNAVPAFQKELDNHITDLLRRTNTKFNQAKKNNQNWTELKSIEFYQKVEKEFEFDKETGIMLGCGFDAEIQSLKDRNLQNSSDETFLNNIDDLVKKMNCLNVFELLEFYKHSVALRTASDISLKLKGELLKSATKEILDDLDNKKGLSVEELTEKLAMKVIYAKIENIMEENKMNSSHKYNKIVDALMNDPSVEPSKIFGKELLNKIYDISQPATDVISSETQKDKLNKAYFERKLDILTVFADLPLDQNIDVKAKGLDFKFKFLQAALDKQTFKNGDSLNQQVLTMKLKEILGHNEIVDSVDSKLVVLEKRLGLVQTQMPSKEAIKNQLNIILHTMPEEMREKLNSVKPFTPRYLNTSFKSKQLQWQNIDTYIPASIMPVKEYLEREQRKKSEPYLHILMSQTKPNEFLKDKRADRERDFYKDTPEFDNDPIVESEYSEVADNLKAGIRDHVSNTVCDVLKIDEVDVEAVDEDDYDEEEDGNNKYIRPKKPEQIDYDVADRDLSGRHNPPTKSTLKKWRKQRKLTNLYGTRVKLPLFKLKECEFENGRYVKDFVESIVEEPLLKDEIDGINELTNFERNEFFDSLRLDYGKFEISEVSEKKTNPTMFDHLFKTDEINQAEKIGYGETLERSIEVYKEINASMYHKHYLSKLFKMQQMDNPLQVNEMLDPEDDPNFGIVKSNVLDALKSFSSTKLATTQDQNLSGAKPNPLYYDGVAPTYFGNGSRKRSKAFAVVEIPGTGKVTVNNRHFLEYFQEPKDRSHMLKSVVAIGKTCEIDLKVYVHGGGINCQADAALVAVSNALIKAFPEFERFLVDRYFTYADKRRVERKKTSKYKARKSYTYVRR